MTKSEFFAPSKDVMIFVTNDDGIESPGLKALAEALADAARKEVGNDARVEAPHRVTHEIRLADQTADLLGDLHVDRSRRLEVVDQPQQRHGRCDRRLCLAREAVLTDDRRTVFEVGTEV